MACEEAAEVARQGFTAVLGPTLAGFVERNIRSLLTVNILLFFHRNPEAVLGLEEMAAHLGRSVEEVEPEVATLRDGGVLSDGGGLIRLKSTRETRATVAELVEACQDQARRPALIALVLSRANRS